MISTVALRYGLDNKCLRVGATPAEVFDEVRRILGPEQLRAARAANLACLEAHLYEMKTYKFKLC